MINFIEKKAKTRIPKHDYVLEKEEMLIPLINFLTPKFDGKWSIALVDPTIKFVNHLIDLNLELSFIDLNMYIGSAKLDTILLKHPKLMPKRQTTYEAFMIAISNMKHDIAHDAVKYLYKAFDGNFESLTETLSKLDTECTSDVIVIDEVKKVCSVIKKPLYASQVYACFMLKTFDRWRNLDKLVHEIGESYAYYALRKQASLWLSEKGKYLNNEETKNREIANVDAAFIAYAFTVFSNSRHPAELYTVFNDIDTRSVKTLERRLDVNL